MAEEKYKFLPATLEDVPEISRVFIDSFTDNVFFYNMNANVEPSMRESNGEHWHRSMMEHAHLYGSRWQKAVEKSSGAIVGFCKWDEPVILNEEQKAEKATFEAEQEARPHPKGANVSLCADFLGQLRAGKKKWMNTEEDFYLNLLAVSRAHHRRGLGGLLLREPLMRADARGAKTYIEASPAGLPLYLRLGWEPVDEIVLDLDRHNVARGRGKHIEKCLMRSPR